MAGAVVLQVQPPARVELEDTAVAALPLDLRTALILFEYEEQTAAEIAEALDCTPKAVENRLYRARQLLRRSLFPAA